MSRVYVIQEALRMLADGRADVCVSFGLLGEEVPFINDTRAGQLRKRVFLEDINRRYFDAAGLEAHIASHQDNQIHVRIKRK